MHRVSSLSGSLTLLLLALSTACADEGASDDGASGDMCLSGEVWNGGDNESPLMHPGRDCLACHQSRGEAQEVVLGGTVYDGDGEPDDCYGLAGVTLQLTDANNVVHEVTSNASGNFMIEETLIATPYSVKLQYEGRERVMLGMQTSLSCNGCHTETGANGAPGRILAP
jgi:hypothetical protein